MIGDAGKGCTFGVGYSFGAHCIDFWKSMNYLWKSIWIAWENLWIICENLWIICENLWIIWENLWYMKHNGGGGGSYCINIISIYIIKEYVKGHVALRKTIIVCCIVKYLKR
jgi:hypothetical protein